MKRLLFFALVSCAAPVAAEDDPLVDLATVSPDFRFDIRYATADNFFGKKAYDEARCILRRSVAEKMARAQKHLAQQRPGWSLLFKDCYRPERYQHLLWQAVVGTEKARYVANPNGKTGSIHSYGAAVDLTLAGPDGAELDLGTAYDHLGPLAEPRLEPRYLAEGKLNAAQVERRRILRSVMKHAGMVGISNEWWHFNAAPAREIRRRYERLDVPFSSVPGPGAKGSRK